MFLDDWTATEIIVFTKPFSLFFLKTYLVHFSEPHL